MRAALSQRSCVRPTRVRRSGPAHRAGPTSDADASGTGDRPSARLSACVRRHAQAGDSEVGCPVPPAASRGSSERRHRRDLVSGRQAALRVGTHAPPSGAAARAESEPTGRSFDLTVPCQKAGFQRSGLATGCAGEPEERTVGVRSLDGRRSPAALPEPATPARGSAAAGRDAARLRKLGFSTAAAEVGSG